MSRLSFILGITLFIIAGTAAFMITFDRTTGETKTTEAKPATRHDSSAPRKKTTRPQAGTRATSSRTLEPQITLPGTTTAHLDQAGLTRVNSIIARTQRDSRQKLGQLSEKYRLTEEQRQQIFPYLVAHHEQAHPAMTIGGQSLPALASGTTLEDSLASFLDPSQQDALIESTLDNDAWWEDVVGQLESDLDTAIDNGEMVLADEEPSGTTNTSDTPAEGHGEASTHNGGNLFDLLGQ